MPSSSTKDYVGMLPAHLACRQQQFLTCITCLFAYTASYQHLASIEECLLCAAYVYHRSGTCIICLSRIISFQPSSKSMLIVFVFRLMRCCTKSFTRSHLWRTKYKKISAVILFAASLSNATNYFKDNSNKDCFTL